MATDLFAGLETPNRFFAPVLETREVAKEVIDRITAGEGGVVRLPEYARWVAWYGVLPAGVQRVVRWMSGIDEAVGKANLHDTDEREKEKDDGSDGASDGVVVDPADVVVREIKGGEKEDSD